MYIGEKRYTGPTHPPPRKTELRALLNRNNMKKKE